MRIVNSFSLRTHAQLGFASNNGERLPSCSCSRYVKDNSDVTGHVLLVTDEAKSGSYKAIEVSLKGHATVRWSETHGSGDSRRTVTYYSHEDYIANTAAVLWSKENAPDGQIAAGSHHAVSLLAEISS